MGTVRRIAHRAKPEWWAAGRFGGKGVPENNADGPLPGFHPPAVPDVPREARCAPPRADAQDQVSRLVNPPLLPAMYGVQLIHEPFIWGS
jgi:hypothetical protein